MLKIGIYGADTRTAGELIRLLVNHPDVDLAQLYAPEHKGESVSAVHHGMLGERELKFTGQFDPKALDVIYICRPDDFTERLLSDEKAAQQQGIEDRDRKRPLKIVEMSGCHVKDYEAAGLDYGLSEMNRKPLVRGARRAVVPRAETSLTLVSLYPIAAHLLLRDGLELEFELPAEYLKETDISESEQDISRQLRRVQASFSGDVKISAKPSASSRAMRMSLTIPCSLKADEIDKLYDGIYDDHNFTWIISGEPDEKEVEGTHKCIIGLSKPDADSLKVVAVADCRMRGGAGEAVHLMNLLCGLHERTGLRMKAIAF